MAQSASVLIGGCVKICPYFLGFLAYFHHFEPPLFLLLLILTIYLPILSNFQLKLTANCLICTMPITRPNFLKHSFPLHFLRHSFNLPNIANFRRHHLFYLLYQSLTLIPLQTSILSLNLKPPTCFNLSSITLFDKHLHLYLPFLCSATFNNTLHPLVTLHIFSQNKTARFLIRIRANAIILFNSNKKMPLYIRHSCCIKIHHF